MAFARKADEEGLTKVAKLFRAAVEAEALHASNHLQVMGEVRSTKGNVGATLAGETSECDKMHLGCLNTAKVESNQQAAWTFDVASMVEQIHAKVFSEVAEQPENNEELRQVDYYVCTICGNTLEVAAPERCPIWRPPKAKPFKVDQCGRL
jgi:rubrerythrin